jgi:hypothetical protein
LRLSSTAAETEVGTGREGIDFMAQRNGLDSEAVARHFERTILARIRRVNVEFLRNCSGSIEDIDQVRAGDERHALRVGDLLKAGNYIDALTYIGHQYRWEALNALVAVDPSDLPELFREVWISGENHWSYRELVSMLARRLSTPKLRRRLFSEDGWNYFEHFHAELRSIEGRNGFVSSDDRGP